ncbi:MAG: hypothetical protein JWQ03_1454, partial [Variovorax sp.]|nr:hypothetical protein [Variovorax sp.]
MQRERPPAALMATTTCPADAAWIALPYADVPRFSVDTLRLQWSRLHIGQGQPALPGEDLLEGWARYHSGDFQGAVKHGEQRGVAGITLVNEATAIYATY